jgi:GDP-D-mannose 3', 5'-epimerase
LSETTILIAGGGGFIGGHLCKRMLDHGFNVRAVDIKPTSEWLQVDQRAQNITADLKSKEACLEVVAGCDQIYNLAADMGGMGFIETHKAQCMLSVLINTHLLMAAVAHGVKKYFFASSACVYAAEKQNEAHSLPLKEQDAYPATPEDGYGWEKLFSERMCRHFSEDYGLEVRIARYHNVHGPFGTFAGGREKAPAALSRKVLECLQFGTPSITIWGDGEQTRSFMYIEDCLKGTIDLMNSEYQQPLNLGSAESISINDLVSLLEGFANIKLERFYSTDAPKGVNGRNSDNTTILKVLDWEPKTSLSEGMLITFNWIKSELENVNKVA